MKNKFIVILLQLILFFVFSERLYAQTIQYTGDTIKILDKGNLISGEGQIQIKINNNIIINSEEFKYFADTKIYKISNKINFIDTLNNLEISAGQILYFEKTGLFEISKKVNLKDNIKEITISGEKIFYSEKKGVFEIVENVVLNDNINKINAKSSQILYSKFEDKIFSNKNTNIIYNSNYDISLSDFEYIITDNKISSKGLVTIEDNISNYFELDGFKLNGKFNQFLGKKLKFIDVEKNEYFLKDVMINMANQNIYGRDLDINFNKSIFGNNKNDPRLNAKSIKIKDQSSIIKKGVFTSCNKDNECPPWSMYAEEIEHDKKKKIINYKNAWLKIYDVPTIYFPKFSHPDPTVKRTSGFLNPKFSNSKNIGTSIDIPYYYVISDNKDLTLKPKLFFNNEIVLQNEYRQISKNSNHIADFSFGSSNFFSSKNKTQLHFYSNSKFDIDSNLFDESKIELNLQKVNNDEYLKKYKIENDQLIKNNNLLHSFLSFEGDKDNIGFYSSLEVYENLSKDKQSRHEFIYPSYEFQKKIFSNKGNDYFFKSYGSQRKYDTNIFEGIIINDILYKSNEKFSKNGIVSNYNALIKNVNVEANNSNKYKDDFEQSILSIIQYNSFYPLKKEGENSINNLTPKISLMYSPNKTKNLSNEKRRIDSSKIFSFNRIANNETVEGGASITYGATFDKVNKKTKKNILKFELSSLLRLKTNEDLPSSSTLGKKSSDVFGNFEIYPNDKFNLKYNFALDNNFNKSNYDSISTTVMVNKFVTTFEYSDEKNELINESFTSNSSTFEIDENNSINFNVRRNNERSATEFYNFIYRYKNDCLVASLRFNKEFYKDADLEPEKELFFTLSLIPFGGM